jgi:hypothetical protein
MSYNDTGARWFFRWAFDITFFVFIKMALLNIIFGIIIDTFAGKKSFFKKIYYYLLKFIFRLIVFVNKLTFFK